MTELLGDWLRAQAERRPDATALVAGSERRSFGDLDRETNQMARLLREGGCGPGDRVAILGPKGLATVVGLLACAKSGCVYVPVDFESPAPRAAKILDRCLPRWLWTDPAAAKRAVELRRELPDANFQVASLGAAFEEPGVRCVASADDARSLPAAEIDASRRRDDVAHLLFTSGSTGVPKGVMITHANVIAFIEWAVSHFGMGPDDRHSFHPPLHFDLSTLDLYAALASGAELHFLPPGVGLLPGKLIEWVGDSRLTQWFSVPSVLNYVAAHGGLSGGALSELRRVLWCGEVLPTPTLIHWMERLPHVRFTNLYGPTETTIASTFFDVPEIPREPRTPVPIGTPCTGEEALVLGEDQSPCPPGQVGELYIGGVGLSPGYWEDPAKTAEAFIEDPRQPGSRLYRTGDLASADEQGLLHFVGRADSQVKSRGYRIELGEIEAALQTLAELRESAVVAIHSGEFEGMALCCAYSVRPGAETSDARLRRSLARLLPSYMLPARWLALEQLPKNANGKIDRPTLKEWFTHGAPNADSGRP
jgi:amino acid adenylation domain-containing protein